MRRVITFAAALAAGSSQALSAPSAPIYNLEGKCDVCSKNTTLQLDQVPLAEVVTILFRDILGTPYVLSPEVGADRRPVSLRFVSNGANARAQVLAYLRGFGLAVVPVGRVDQVVQAGRSPQVGPVPAPLSAFGQAEGPARSLAHHEAEGRPFSGDKPEFVLEVAAAYWPKYREPGYLAGVLSTLLPKLRFGGRPADEPRAGSQTAGSLPRDLLTFIGPDDDVKRARSVLEQIDKAEIGLTIKATIYEVQTGRTNASALSLALGVLGGRFSLGLGGDTRNSLETFARVSTANFEGVASALSSDNRFRVVTAPSLVARSGTEARLTSGQQVPVIGSVSYQDGSGPIQSVDYRDSGVILRVTPTAYARVIDLAIEQELSTFVRTDTGVAGSPTLIKRAASNRVSVVPGEVVVLGGLTEDKDTQSRSGLFGIFPNRRKETARTEILLVLQVDHAGGSGFSPRPERSEDAAKTGPLTVPDMQEQ